MHEDDDGLLAQEDTQDEERQEKESITQTARRKLEDYLEERELRRQLDDLFGAPE